MLTTIQRRIARDIVVMFFVSLFVITVLVMFIGVARESLQQGLGVIGVLRMLPYALPNALSLAVPGTALFSVCSVYGRMSADNEFTAMQAVGISPLPAMWPAIIITTTLSIATVGLINVSFTWGFHGIQRVVISSIERMAYGVLERDHSFQRGQLSLMVRDVEGKTLIEPVINIRRGNSDPITINARTAVLTYDDATEGLELSATNGSVRVGDMASFHFTDTYVQTVPLNTGPAEDLLTAHPSHMPMRDLPKATVRQVADIHQRESEMAVRVGFSVLASRTEEIASAKTADRWAAIESSQKRLHRLDAEMHRRWASGFTCLAMSMIGIPLAIRLRTSDVMTTFGIVFLPTVVIYYPIFALTLDMAKDGRIPAQGVWIANALFISVSILLMRKVIYSPA